jgi:hypothetical protein
MGVDFVEHETCCGPAYVGHRIDLLTDQCLDEERGQFCLLVRRKRVFG